MVLEKRTGRSSEWKDSKEGGTNTICLLASMGHWFQEPPWISKFKDAQISYIKWPSTMATVSHHIHRYWDSVRALLLKSGLEILDVNHVKLAVLKSS